MSTKNFEDLIQSTQFISECKDLLTQEKRKSDAIISLLKKLQTELNELSKEKLELISDLLKIDTSDVLGIASFYGFLGHAIKKNTVEICVNINCWLKGAPEILEEAKKWIEKSSLNNGCNLVEVNCFNLCESAPVVCINEKFHEKTDALHIPEILNDSLSLNSKN